MKKGQSVKEMREIYDRKLMKILHEKLHNSIIGESEDEIL